MIGAKKGTWGEFSKSIQMFPPAADERDPSTLDTGAVEVRAFPGDSRLISGFKGSVPCGERIVSGSTTIRRGGCREIDGADSLLGD